MLYGIMTSGILIFPNLYLTYVRGRLQSVYAFRKAKFCVVPSRAIFEGWMFLDFFLGLLSNII
jgi:hypothetical protein